MIIKCAIDAEVFSGNLGLQIRERQELVKDGFGSGLKRRGKQRVASLNVRYCYVGKSLRYPGIATLTSNHI
ncbi:hypothetical protein [Flavisolibacter nicotianae]|uniref:hypothetical protein n=1 Tax=Flavisolibacter nicotianae TaxID=2364882 RepID=UPI000EACEF5A|nr:hypothetical protein [Flavisolibacter nicotianae]